MSVTDLSALQLYGLIVLANVMVILVLYGLREINRVERKAGRAVLYFGAAALILLPAAFGAYTLQASSPSVQASELSDPLGIR